MATVMQRVAAPLRGWGARRALRSARRAADEQLFASRLPSPRLAWRTEELTSRDHRLSLGRSLTDAVHASDERLLPSASPLNRGGVGEGRRGVLGRASRILDLDRPVLPRGVLLVERLLGDGSGPLYGRGDPRRLRTATEQARTALERESTNGAPL